MRLYHDRCPNRLSDKIDLNTKHYLEEGKDITRVKFPAEAISVALSVWLLCLVITIFDDFSTTSQKNITNLDIKLATEVVWQRNFVIFAKLNLTVHCQTSNPEN